MFIFQCGGEKGNEKRSRKKEKKKRNKQQKKIIMIMIIITTGHRLLLGVLLTPISQLYLLATLLLIKSVLVK